MKIIYKTYDKHKRNYLLLVAFIAIVSVGYIIHAKTSYVKEVDADAIVAAPTDEQAVVLESAIIYKFVDGEYVPVGELPASINLTIDSYSGDYAHVQGTDYFVETKTLTGGYVDVDYISTGNFRSIGTLKLTQDYVVYAQGSNREIGSIAAGETVEIIGADGNILYIDWFDYLAYIELDKDFNMSEYNIVNTTDVTFNSYPVDEYSTVERDSCTYNYSVVSLIQENKISNICTSITSNFFIVDEENAPTVVDIIDSYDIYKYAGNIVLPYEYYTKIDTPYKYVESYPIDSEEIPQGFEGLIFTTDKTKCNLTNYVCY